MPQTLRTARLSLIPLAAADADDVLRIYSDARTWQHWPDGRFTRMEQVHQLIEEAETSRREHGLGSWAIRLASDDADTEGPIIGVGGVRYFDDAKVFNLGYRLDPSAWGQGFASEVAFATLEAASVTSPHIPVTARALTNNPASIAVLDKLGLTLLWEGVRTNVESPVPCRVYADRVLDAVSYDWLVANA